MSDLTQFRDHCRRMATLTPAPQKDRAAKLHRDRELWTMLADEVDAYLDGPTDEPLDLG